MSCCFTSGKETNGQVWSVPETQPLAVWVLPTRCHNSAGIVSPLARLGMAGWKLNFCLLSFLIWFGDFKGINWHTIFWGLWGSRNSSRTAEFAGLEGAGWSTAFVHSWCDLTIYCPNQHILRVKGGLLITMPGQEEKMGCAGHLDIVTQIGWFFCRSFRISGTQTHWLSSEVRHSQLWPRAFGSSCPKGILPPCQVIYLGFVLSGRGGYVSASRTASYLGFLYVK